MGRKGSLRCMRSRRIQRPLLEARCGLRGELGRSSGVCSSRGTLLSGSLRSWGRNRGGCESGAWHI